MGSSQAMAAVDQMQYRPGMRCRLARAVRSNSA